MWSTIGDVGISPFIVKRLKAPFALSPIPGDNLVSTSESLFNASVWTIKAPLLSHHLLRSAIAFTLFSTLRSIVHDLFLYYLIKTPSPFIRSVLARTATEYA